VPSDMLLILLFRPHFATLRRPPLTCGHMAVRSDAAPTLEQATIAPRTCELGECQLMQGRMFGRNEQDCRRNKLR
jgi:hypothetical protein